MEISKFFDKKNIPNINEAILISKKYKIGLYPKYLFFLSELTSTSLLESVDYLSKNIEINFLDDKKENFNLEILFNSQIKRNFEVIGIEHKLKDLKIEEIKKEVSKKIVFNDLMSKCLILNLGFYFENNFKIKDFKNYLFDFKSFIEKNLQNNTIDLINEFKISGVEIKDKSGTYIGARMGRPEKAKMRKEFKVDSKKTKAHGIFPVGEDGGKFNNIIEAYQKSGKISADFEIFLDENSAYSINRFNEKNNEKYDKVFFEKYTGIEVSKSKVKEENVRYCNIDLDIKKIINEVREKLKILELPKMLKGVSHTTSVKHTTENLAKAFLREKNKIFVNKDGTCRYDMIEMGLTHFKPKEIGTSIQKLKDFGYVKDYLGNELENENQILEIFPQDVILPDCGIGDDEKASEFIKNVGNFIDDELEKIYNLERFYNFKSIEDTLGHLIVGLAPHTSAGIIGRIIGYSKTQGCFSHPVWHAAQRRNLDGDENGMILLLDALINFSRDFLPNRRGTKTMDTPLVLTSHLYLDQIDDEVFSLDCQKDFDKEFFEMTKNYGLTSKVKIKNLKDNLKIEDLDKKYFNNHFTHNIDNFNNTIVYSSYKDIPTMSEKLEKQLEIGKKIRAVDENKVGTLIIDKHFMKDIKGNLRKFGMQEFRCTNCNQRYRRPTLSGKCVKCYKNSINFTIAEGFIKKYVDPSFNIIKNYEVDPYIIETLELTQLRIEGVFGKEKEIQKGLNSFFEEKK